MIRAPRFKQVIYNLEEQNPQIWRQTSLDSATIYHGKEKSS